MNKTVLAIETSCDETAVAVVKNGREVLSNVISSQIETHKMYGGVVPEIASRMHLEKIDYIVDRAILESGLGLNEIDIIAGTNGPGLVGALLTGLSYAKGLSFSLDKPFIAVNHIDGHISANYLENNDFEPPYIGLVVSGGHTLIIKVLDYGKYELLGSTRDDAAGEAFDKVARTLGLEYPGGPIIDKISKNANNKYTSFPRSFIDDDHLDFSFSGIKSAVLNFVHNKNQKNEEIAINDIAASFQKAVVDVLVIKAIKACKINNIKKLSIAGGVSANSELRYEIQKEADKNDILVKIPNIKYCTDNAAMIGSAAYYSYKNNHKFDYSVNAKPNLTL